MGVVALGVAGLGPRGDATMHVLKVLRFLEIFCAFSMLVITILGGFSVRTGALSQFTIQGTS